MSSMAKPARAGSGNCRPGGSQELEHGRHGGSEESHADRHLGQEQAHPEADREHGHRALERLPEQPDPATHLPMIAANVSPTISMPSARTATGFEKRWIVSRQAIRW